MPIYEYNCNNCGRIEIMRSIKSDDLTTCPNCDSCDFQKLISLPAGFIDKNRESNQYNDIKAAKYWIDKNGNKHKVTEADGHLNSPTVSSKKTASPEDIKRKKDMYAKISKKKRQKESYARYVKSIKRNMGK